MPVLRLREEGFCVTALFANPNIHPLKEYLRRREAMALCAAHLALPVLWQDDLWDIAAWLRQNPWQNCQHCCAARLDLTAQTALHKGFDAFSSSLLYSQYQQHETIAHAGKAHGQSYGIDFVYRDFRTDGQQGIDISKTLGVYRQAYCGCIFSEAERYARIAARTARTRAAMSSASTSSDTRAQQRAP